MMMPDGEFTVAGGIPAFGRHPRWHLGSETTSMFLTLFGGPEESSGEEGRLHHVD